VKIENPVEYGLVLYGVFLHLRHIFMIRGLVEGNAWEEDHFRADLAQDEIAGFDCTSDDVFEILDFREVGVDQAVGLGPGDFSALVDVLNEALNVN